MYNEKLNVKTTLFLFILNNNNVVLYSNPIEIAVLL